MSATYIQMNGASFERGFITSTPMSEFIAWGTKQGFYRKYPDKQKEMLTAVWKLANPKKK